MFYNSPKFKIDINKLTKDTKLKFVSCNKNLRVPMICPWCNTPREAIKEANYNLKNMIEPLYQNDSRYKMIASWGKMLDNSNNSFLVKFNVALNIQYLFDITTFDISWKPDIPKDFKQDFIAKQNKKNANNNFKMNINKIAYNTKIAFKNMDNSKTIILTPYDVISFADNFFKENKNVISTIFANDYELEIETFKMWKNMLEADMSETLRMWKNVLKENKLKPDILDNTRNFFLIKFNVALNVLYLYNIITFDFIWQPDVSDVFKHDFKTRISN